VWFVPRLVGALFSNAGFSQNIETYLLKCELSLTLASRRHQMVYLFLALAFAWAQKNKEPKKCP